MKTILITIILMFLTNIGVSQEMRGTWLARDAFSSKDKLANIMDSLANNNINVVYVNMWSRGYPLWNSKVFYDETGYFIDPSFQGRDILNEAILEGHRVGLHVEAWFEYGFVGGWTGNNPPGGKGAIFVKHPNWVAKTQNGTERDASNFFWMAQANQEAQDFLIALAAEVARNYDVDGIELDRIRYPNLQYGYDSATIALYKIDHNDSLPPDNYQDSNWLRWRADNLNNFIARAYDSIKSINQHINISNAPSLYSSSAYTSYDSFAQDWYWWVNNNKIDNVQVQSYVSNSTLFGNIIDFIKTKVNFSKVFPSFAIAPNGVPISLSDLYNFVNITRIKGLKGNAIWYYNDLAPNLNSFKANVFQSKQFPPYSTPNWREFRDVTIVTDSANLIKTGEWIVSSNLGYSGNSIFAKSGSLSTADYYFDVPANGVYEIYVFLVTSSNRTDSAIYKLYDSTNSVTVKILNQNNSLNQRWQKLTDLPLKVGRQKVISISNENLQMNKYLSADASMILLNRSKSPNSVTGLNGFGNKMLNENKFNLRSYPNPFNSQFRLVFNIQDHIKYKISFIDILGKEIFSYYQEPENIGEQTVSFNLDRYKIASGVYFLNISQAEKQESIKIILTK